MWKRHTLTTAAPTMRVAFAGRGSIYVEGTFGAGTVQLKPVAQNDDGTQTVASDFLYEMDGAAGSLSADTPSGLYELALVGSSGATVYVFVHDQSDKVISR